MISVESTDKRDRYEAVEHCDIVHFPGEALNNLRQTYHQEPLPAFFRSMLRHDADSFDRQIMRHSPEIFSWTSSCDYFIRPNVPKYRPEILLDNFSYRWRKAGKLYLVAWHLHPALTRYVKSDLPSPRAATLSEMKICDIEAASGIEFLTTPFDLNASHAQSLYQLREHVHYQLRYQYGILEPRQAALYFHIYNMPCYAVLHLQIRYGTSLHVAEDVRTFYLDQVIDWLKTGRNFCEMLNEQGRSAYFFANDNLELKKYLLNVPGSMLRENLPNPYHVPLR